MQQKSYKSIRRSRSRVRHNKENPCNEANPIQPKIISIVHRLIRKDLRTSLVNLIVISTQLRAVVFSWSKTVPILFTKIYT